MISKNIKNFNTLILLLITTILSALFVFSSLKNMDNLITTKVDFSYDILKENKYYKELTESLPVAFSNNQILLLSRDDLQEITYKNYIDLYNISKEEGFKYDYADNLYTETGEPLKQKFYRVKEDDRLIYTTIKYEQQEDNTYLPLEEQIAMISKNYKSEIKENTEFSDLVSVQLKEGKMIFFNIVDKYNKYELPFKMLIEGVFLILTMFISLLFSFSYGIFITSSRKKHYVKKEKLKKVNYDLFKNARKKKDINYKNMNHELLKKAIKESYECKEIKTKEKIKESININMENE